MLYLALTLLLLGTALATRGLIGRRVGDEPRCRKCKYNLTGVESKECPECGRPWNLETAARGLRFRRRLPLTLGIIACVIGAALQTPAVQRRSRMAYLYQYLPTKWILPAARDGDWQAFFVIRNRFSGFSPSERTAFIDVALRQQVSPRPYFEVAPWVDLLGQLWRRDQLTDQQQTQFEDQFAWLRLAVRPRVRSGDRIPIDIVQVLRAPRTSPYSDEFTLEGLTLDGIRMDVPGYWVTEQAFPLTHCADHAISYFLDQPKDFKPGPHRVAIDVVRRRLKWNDDAPPNSQVVWDRSERLEGQFESLPPGQDGSITILTDAAIGQRIRDAISPNVSITINPATGEKRLSVDAFPIGQIPVAGLTYVIYVVPPNSSDRLRYGDYWKEEYDGHGSITGADAILKLVNVGDAVTVILRFDPESARETTRMGSTWKGELEFGPIIVKQAPWRAPQQSPPDPTWARFRLRTAIERAQATQPTRDNYVEVQVEPPETRRKFVGPPAPLRLRAAASIRSVLSALTPAPASQRATTP